MFSELIKNRKLLPDSFLKLLNFINNHSDSNINDELIVNYNNSYESFTTLDTFISNIHLYSIEQISDILPFYDFNKDIFKGTIKNIPVNYNKKYFSKKEFDLFIHNNNYIITSESNKQGYEIFSNPNVSLEQFKLLFNKFKKEVNIDKNLILQNSFFLSYLFKNEHLDILNFLIDEIDLSMNDIVDGSPLFFYANTPESLQYVFDKGFDISLKNKEGINLLEHISTSSNSTALINTFNKNINVNKFDVLNTYLSSHKDLATINSLLKKISIEKQINIKDISINDKNLISLSLENKNLSFVFNAINYKKNYEKNNSYYINNIKTNDYIELLKFYKDKNKFKKYVKTLDSYKNNLIHNALFNNVDWNQFFKDKDLINNLLFTFLDCSLYFSDLKEVNSLFPVNNKILTELNEKYNNSTTSKLFSSFFNKIIKNLDQNLFITFLEKRIKNDELNIDSSYFNLTHLTIISEYLTDENKHKLGSLLFNVISHNFDKNKTHNYFITLISLELLKNIDNNQYSKFNEIKKFFMNNYIQKEFIDSFDIILSKKYLDLQLNPIIQPSSNDIIKKINKI